MELIQELNEKQQQAATAMEGAMLVLAGPGTGKTKVITHPNRASHSAPSCATTQYPRCHLYK